MEKTYRIRKKAASFAGMSGRNPTASLLRSGTMRKGSLRCAFEPLANFRIRCFFATDVAFGRMRRLVARYFPRSERNSPAMVSRTPASEPQSGEKPRSGSAGSERAARDEDAVVAERRELLRHDGVHGPRARRRQGQRHADEPRLPQPAFCDKAARRAAREADQAHARHGHREADEERRAQALFQHDGRRDAGEQRRRGHHVVNVSAMFSSR